MVEDWYRWLPTLEVDPEYVHQRALRFADNMKKCSCWMCRNERALYGPTLRERMVCEAIEDE